MNGWTIKTTVPHADRKSSHGCGLSLIEAIIQLVNATDHSALGAVIDDDMGVVESALAELALTGVDEGKLADNLAVLLSAHTILSARRVTMSPLSESK